MNEQISTQIAYIHGRVEAQIEAFANSLNIPTRFLTARVGALLLGKESREVLGTQDRMPVVPREARKNGKAVAKVAMVKRAHGKSHMTEAGRRKVSEAGRRKMSEAMKKRWSTIWKDKRKTT